MVVFLAAVCRPSGLAAVCRPLGLLLLHCSSTLLLFKSRTTKPGASPKGLALPAHLLEDGVRREPGPLRSVDCGFLT